MFNRLSAKYQNVVRNFHSFFCILLIQVQHLEAVRRLKEGGMRLQRTVYFAFLIFFLK